MGSSTNSKFFDSGPREKERENSKRYSVGNKIFNEEDREEFESLLRNLTTERISVGNALLYCFDHAEYSAEIVLIIFQSLCIEETNNKKKVQILFYFI